VGLFVGQVFNLPKFWQVENLPHKETRYTFAETALAVAAGVPAKRVARHLPK